MKYVVVASTFTGNLGAASMLEAAIQTISAKDQHAEFTVLTVYPKQDALANTYKNVQVLSAKPLTLALYINPLALLYKLLVPLRAVLKRQKHVRAIVEADVYLDQGGVTFVQGRTVFLIYNLATILPALFVKTPVIKCSQALGPFTGRLNRTLASHFLPKMKTIFARGEKTQSYLQTLTLSNVAPAADYAFLLNVSKENNESVRKLFNSYVIEREGKTVCIVPSKLIRKKLDGAGGNYVQLMQDFIHKLVGDGYTVILLPHSTRFYTTKTHNNDVPVCREIAAGITSYRFHFIHKELNAQQVRAVIARSDILITSRFHGMVSGLASCVPTLVVGWSHKYQEVMDQFGLARHALSTKELTLGRLESEFNSVFKDKKKIRKQIEEKLPKVIESARTQVDEIIAVASGI